MPLVQVELVFVKMVVGLLVLTPEQVLQNTGVVQAEAVGQAQWVKVGLVVQMKLQDQLAMDMVLVEAVEVEEAYYQMVVIILMPLGLVEMALRVGQKWNGLHK
jgi:hypothetical protein